MFSVHRVWSDQLSTKNIILLFFTIVLGFASVITLAQIQIPSDINNAHQTIGRVTITNDGTADGTLYRDFNSGGKTFIVSGLQEQSSFSWKVLGIQEDGELVYALSSNLSINWAGDKYRSGNGSDIWTIYSGNVGIGTQVMSGRLHIKSSWDTDIYIEEQTTGMAASLRLSTPKGMWIIWWDSNPDVFFIGIPNKQEYFTINQSGNIGMWTTGSTYPLEIKQTSTSNDIIKGNCTRN